jgi:hypothetical protein
VTRSRPPFRLALEQLIDAFARAVLDVVRAATLGEILDLGATPNLGPSRASPVEAKATRAPSRSRPRRATRGPRAPNAVARGEAPPEAPDDVEEPASVGTEINGLALLASLEDQAAVHGRPEPDLPPPAPAAPPPVVAPIATPARVLRAGEDVLRSGAGTVVIRRRRAS